MTMRRIYPLLLQTWLPVAVLCGWAILSNTTSMLFLPPLQEVLSSVVILLTEHASSDLIPSLLRLAGGYSLALVTGLILGLILGHSRRLAEILDPYLHFLRALPPPALVPVAIVIFGIGDVMKIWVIGFGALWPILLNTIDGVRATDPVVRQMSRVYKLKFWTDLLLVAVPAAAPRMLAGARTGLQVAILLAVVSEMVGSSNGLGYFLISAQQSFSFSDVWAGMLVLSLVGFGLNVGFERIEKWAAPWYFASREQELHTIAQPL